jgi:hypothetical protein
MPRFSNLLVLAAFLAPPPLHAQGALPVYREPHHRLVFEEGAVRILDVTIPVGDTTLFHLHDAPILTVRLAVPRVAVQILGKAWEDLGVPDPSKMYPGVVDSDTTYSARPLVHRVANLGPGLFHLIAVTNGSPGRGPGPHVDATVLPGRLERTSSWFQASRLTLPPMAATEWSTPTFPLVIILPLGGQASVEQDGRKPRLLSEPGPWAFLPAGTRYRVRNAGGGAVDLVFVAAF